MANTRRIEIDDSRGKKKCKIEEEVSPECYYTLEVIFHRATGLDPNYFRTYKERGFYLLISDETCLLYKKLALNQPVWSTHLKIRYNEFPVNEYLYVEVVEGNRNDDVGTSKGLRVLGRARVPVPQKLGDIINRNQELERFCEGRLTLGGFLQMELRLSRTDIED